LNYWKREQTTKNSPNKIYNAFLPWICLFWLYNIYYSCIFLKIRATRILLIKETYLFFLVTFVVLKWYKWKKVIIYHFINLWKYKNNITKGIFLIFYYYFYRLDGKFWSYLTIISYREFIQLQIKRTNNKNSNIT
jgi:hypothetical protein